MTNENLNKAKFNLQDLIMRIDDPDILRELKTILCEVNAIPDDIAQTIIKYENYNDRESLLSTISELHEQNQRLISEQENQLKDLNDTIDGLEKENRTLYDKIKDLTEINALSKKLIRNLENGC